MTTSKLGRLITIIEETKGALSFQELAEELDATPERVQGMLDFWIKKGKIKTVTSSIECGTCSTQDDCPFILKMPGVYELINNGHGNLIEIIQQPCK